jgi:TolB-like protein
MSPFLSRISLIIVPAVLLAITGFSQTGSTAPVPGERERVAVFQFSLHGLSLEEGAQLTKRFASVLGESDRFDVIVANSLKSSEGIADPRSLAEAGKSVGVQKVVHVDVVRREPLTILQIRLVNVSDAALLYAERVDYSGELGSLLSDVIPEQARKLRSSHLDSKTPWAKAAFLFGACCGAILLIFWHFKRRDAVRSSMRTKD